MVSSILPERPAPLLLRPAPIELVVRREPLAAIREVLAISIHDIVNDPRWKRIVGELYGVSRRIEEEAWLRRQLQDWEAREWILSHL